MKKILFVVLGLVVFYSGFSQAFTKDTKLLTMYLGGGNMFHIPVNYSYNSYWNNGFFSPITGQMGVEMEFGVHKYVGVGFNVGIGGRANGLVFGNELNIPIGAVANFHWWQLLDDKVAKDLKSDKLDLYAGLDLGSGVAMHFDSYGNTYTDALVFVGPHLGVKFYPNKRLGLGAELGYGKTFANLNMSFKLNK